MSRTPPELDQKMSRHRMLKSCARRSRLCGSGKRSIKLCKRTSKRVARNMAVRAKETLQVEELEVVADMGYYDGAEVKQCAAAGIKTYIPKPLTSVNQKRGLFTKQDFVYDEAKDCYLCPAGEELTYRYESFEQNRQLRYYTTSKCLSCPIKAQCTTNQRERRLSRWVDEKLLEDMARRVRARPELMRRRQQ